MSHALNTYDVFDTLIARRSVEPREVLHKLERRAGIPGLAQARIAADQNLGALGMSYDLREIWREAGKSLSLNNSMIVRLYDLEVSIEHEEVIPIPENLALVRDGDVLVSDTYLPADVVMSLLRRAGLDKTVGLVVTNDGKFRSWIWPKLQAQFTIREHFGDNLHSDGKTPSEAGIKSVIYTGARRSPVEQFLHDQGWGSLASLVREVRLANPFPDTRPYERHLWLLTCQLNFPLLVFTSVWLDRLARDTATAEVLFVSRDCRLWHGLYQALFPQQRARYLYASRKCLLKPTANYLAYFRATWHAESLIVDLFSTGISWSRLFQRLDTNGRLFCIGRVDNYAYSQDSTPPDEWVDMNVVFRNSEFGAPINKNVEMLNYAPHPVVEDVVCVEGSAPVPIFASSLEYVRALPEAADRAFSACVHALPHYADVLPDRPDSLGDLIQKWVSLICADQQLPNIYAGHQEADAAYLRQLLE